MSYCFPIHPKGKTHRGNWLFTFVSFSHITGLRQKQNVNKVNEHVLTMIMKLVILSYVLEKVLT